MASTIHACLDVLKIPRAVFYRTEGSCGGSPEGFNRSLLAVYPWGPPHEPLLSVGSQSAGPEEGCTAETGFANHTSQLGHF